MSLHEARKFRPYPCGEEIEQKLPGNSTSQSRKKSLDDSDSASVHVQLFGEMCFVCRSSAAKPADDGDENSAQLENLVCEPIPYSQQTRAGQLLTMQH